MELDCHVSGPNVLLDRLDELYQEIYRITSQLLSRSSASEAEELPQRMHLVEKVIDREIQRSKRYNRYCTAAVMTLKHRRASDAIRIAVGCFRDTDVVGVMDEQDASREGKLARLVVLLPETEREGGNVALRRAASLLAADEPSYGLAVYPEDATTARDLMRVAWVGAN